MVQFKLLPKNARTCIAVEPLWAFFGPVVSYFMPLYQRARGLSEMQMGLLNSLAIASGLVFYSLAAPITNKLGRRRTSLVFDLLSWTISMVLWAFSTSFAWFLAAAVFNSVVRVVFVSWNLLISEDADDAQRSTVFGWINIIGTFGGFTTLLGGLLIDSFGLVQSMRTIFLLGSLSMTTMFVIRYLGTSETRMGSYLMEKTKSQSFALLVLSQLPKAGKAMREPFFRRMIGIYFIANSMLAIDFFRILYLREEKALSPLLVSSIPALSALVSLFVFFRVLPSKKLGQNPNHLGSAFLFCMVAQTLLILMPRGSAISAILIFPSMQTAYALLCTLRDTSFMNGTDPDHRSERFSLIQMLMMLFSIPMGWLAGLLYSILPHLPFVLATGLYACGYILSRSLPTQQKDATQARRS
ncbi:MAG TPA: MFS transporter [Rectinemataceae bacterium]